MAAGTAVGAGGRRVAEEDLAPLEVRLLALERTGGREDFERSGSEVILITFIGDRRIGLDRKGVGHGLRRRDLIEPGGHGCIERLDRRLVGCGEAGVGGVEGEAFADVVGALKVEVGPTEQPNGHGGVGLGGFRSPDLDCPRLIAGLEDQRFGTGLDTAVDLRADLVLGDLHAAEVEDDLFELLVGERTAATATPGRHDTVSAVVEHVENLVLGVAGHQRVESRSLPVHLGHELARRRGDGGVDDTTGALRAVAVHALGTLEIDLLATVGGDPPRVEIPAFVTPRLTEPVERQGDSHDRQQHQARAERKIELLALEILVGEVRLAVRGELDLRADFVASRSDVEVDVDDPTEEDDRQDDESDGSLCGGGEQHASVGWSRTL